MTKQARVGAEFVGGPRDGERIVVNATEQCASCSQVIVCQAGIPNPAFSEDAPWEPPFSGVQTLRYRCTDDITVTDDGLAWYFRLEEAP